MYAGEGGNWISRQVFLGKWRLEGSSWKTYSPGLNRRKLGFSRYTPRRGNQVKGSRRIQPPQVRYPKSCRWNGRRPLRRSTRYPRNGHLNTQAEWCLRKQRLIAG